MKKKPDIANGTIWIEKDGIKYFGKGPLELLEGIEKTGSINESAKLMGLSYKKAWTIIQRINEVTESEMIHTKTGGTKGGGAVISDEGKALMKQYKKLVVKFRQFLKKEGDRL